MSEEIKDLKEQLENLKSSLEREKAISNSLREEVELYGTVDDDFVLYPHQDNIITRGILSELFANLDNIPIPDLEKFINQYEK